MPFMHPGLEVIDRFLNRLVADASRKRHLQPSAAPAAFERSWITAWLYAVAVGDDRRQCQFAEELFTVSSLSLVRERVDGDSLRRDVQLVERSGKVTVIVATFGVGDDAGFNRPFPVAHRADHGPLFLQSTYEQTTALPEDHHQAERYLNAVANDGRMRPPLE
jgi:hypothetical protein